MKRKAYYDASLTAEDRAAIVQTRARSSFDYDQRRDYYLDLRHADDEIQNRAAVADHSMTASPATSGQDSGLRRPDPPQSDAKVIASRRASGTGRHQS